MKFILFGYLIFIHHSLASMKSLGGTMHSSKMAVEYSVLNTGHHVLTVKEKLGVKNNKATFKEIQLVELNIKPDESLSTYNGFMCTAESDKFVYGIILKKNASESKNFHPERAWQVDKKNLMLVPIKNPTTVNCKWFPEGETQYPFK
ncbi:MAG: hypothetical protein KDD40_04470 [Bdellovibrionales bacterium]|nr:hypothetical protein [Bdellovibrionales bacterium]